MIATAKKRLLVTEETLSCGLFSKKEASGLISSGVRHVHSSSLGERDSLAKITKDAIATGTPTPFPWEFLEANQIEISSSNQRTKVIETVLEAGSPHARRDLNDRITSVLEELLTNALFHSYLRADRSPKYPRHLPANLDRREKLILKHSAQRSGIYLSLQDKGGNFSFEDVAQSFLRCYGDSGQQISGKEGGAGLGLYMVFELATHLKVEIDKGHNTTVSCWLNDTRSLDPNFFSFNYFEKGSSNAK